MKKALFWLYLINAILLVTHEIDSAYWHEWELLGLPGDISGFLLLHLPLLFLLFYGLILVYEQTHSGLIFSLLLSLAGIFAFVVHVYFLSLGRSEFNLPISLAILITAFIVSLIQSGLTIQALKNTNVTQLG